MPATLADMSNAGAGCKCQSDAKLAAWFMPPCSRHTSWV